MNAKEYLGRAYWLDRQISQKDEKLIAMKSALHGRAIRYDMDGAQHGASGNSVENAYLKVLEFEQTINAEIDKLVDLKLEIQQTINSLNNPALRELLDRRYLCFQRWERIAAEMNYSIQRVYQLHNVALSYVDKELRASKKD